MNHPPDNSARGARRLWPRWLRPPVPVAVPGVVALVAAVVVVAAPDVSGAREAWP